MRLSLPRVTSWTYAVVFILIAVAVSIAFYTQVVTLKDMVTPLVPLLGTYLGATLAFRLREAEDSRKVLAERRGAINRALFILIRQTNAIFQLAEDFEKYASPLERAFNMPAMKPPPYEDLMQNYSDLAFLLDPPSDPSLLIHMAIEQERFYQALESLKVRNEFYVGELQPALAKLVLNGKSVAAEQARTLLGERLFNSALSGAEHAREHVQACKASVPAMQKALLRQAKELFPDHKFIDYEMEKTRSPISGVEHGSTK